MYKLTSLVWHDVVIRRCYERIIDRLHARQRADCRNATILQRGVVWEKYNPPVFDEDVGGLYPRPQTAYISDWGESTDFLWLDSKRNQYGNVSCAYTGWHYTSIKHFLQHPRHLWPHHYRSSLPPLLLPPLLLWNWYKVIKSNLSLNDKNDS